MDEPIADVDVPTAPVPTATAPAATAAAEPARTEQDDEAERPPRKRRRWILPTAIAPVVVLVVLVIGWAVDTSSGGVARNVNLAGADISRMSETELHQRVASLASDFATVPVEITAQPEPGGTGGRATYTTTAGAIGLMIDQDRTVEQALDEGDESFFLARPFAWVSSFLAERDAPIAYRISSDQVATATVKLEGEDRVPAAEPTVELVEGQFRVVPGKPGSGLDPKRVARALIAAAEHRPANDDPVRISLRRSPIPPVGADSSAEKAAAGLEALVKEPITITTPEGDRTIAADTLRTWVTLTTAPDGTVGADLDPAKVSRGLKAAFASVAGGPTDAHFTVQGGKPVIVPEQPGKVCCGDGAAAKILTAMQDGTRTAALELVDGPPSTTAAELGKLGIVEEIGQPAAFGPTTHHACCQPRVQNIHRIADLVRGQVILPGETFSINETVGVRTVAKGFTSAPAIVDGEHADQIGGGISQFGTTLFNASLYAGLDFGEYQSHSLWFDRYPKGHEATLSYPHPDLEVKNTTPYGVLIWPEYDSTTLTVHLYSTHYVDVQVGEPTPSPAGACTKWTTPRTRTYVDGRVDHDTVFARYRPAEGVDC
jgi:vancomycin resistance protein YoaR